MQDRTAIDTIKGYFYQFDYTILKILELLQDTDHVLVEGVEDVDIKTATEETAIQCKYYECTKYNHSVIATSIRLMLDHFKEVKNGSKQKISYCLYGHFKSGQEKLSIPVTDIEFLKNKFLTFSKNKVTHYHHLDLGLRDEDLSEFLLRLKIVNTADNYETQLNKIFDLLKKQFTCNQFQAEAFYYNNAIKFIKDVAVHKNSTNRKIGKKNFLIQIDTKKILFDEWFIAYKGKRKHFADLRKQYFSVLNINSFERFFLFEIPIKNHTRSEIKDLIFTISKKWSKLSKRESEPFCPYIYIHEISPQELIDLKSELFTEGFISIDGFDFSGASFNPKSISINASYNNNIKAKIINKIDFLDLTLNEITKTKEIYQFFISKPFFEKDYPNIKQVYIQIEELKDMYDII